MALMAIFLVIPEEVCHVRSYSLSFQCNDQKRGEVHGRWLREFLLHQIIYLQESMELPLVPCIVKELLGHERVAAPPLDKDFPSPPTVCVWGGGGVAEVRSIICPSSVEASVVVVHDPTEAQVLPSQSQEPVARSSWKGGKILQSKAT
jgi:hypothetical protein